MYIRPAITNLLLTLLLVHTSRWNLQAADNDTLHWVAGDSLQGTLVSANSESITWKSSIFADPLRIDPAVLSNISFAKSGETETVIADSLRVSMLNGDVLFGDLISAAEETFRLRSSRFGTIDLRRDQIRSLRRIDSPGLVFLGPQGLAGWRHPLFAQWAAPPGWKEINDGRLTTSKSEAVIFRPTEFPAKCEIELVLSSTQRPAFVMSLGSNAETSLRLETWDNALVAMSENDFVSVDTIVDSQRKIHLFLFVDFAARRMTIFSDAGRQLAEISAEEVDPGTSGILLRNGEHDLTLEYLSIAKWDGSPFQGVQSERSRVHTADGRVLYGQIVGVAEDHQSIRVSDGDTTSEIRLTEIRGLVVSEGDDPADSSDPVQIMFHSGELISGEIRDLQDGRISLQTRHSASPIVGSLKGAQLLQLPGSVTPPSEPDRMYFPSGSLQGTLMVEDDAKAPIRWKPLGGLNASTLTASGRARFVRGQPAASVAIDTDAFPDVVYLTNNDVIPCRLLSCLNDTIQIESPFCQVRGIPAAEVRAVELHQSSRPGRHGFGDSGWRRIVGTPLIEPQRLVFKASEAVGHTSALTGDVMQFRLTWGEHVSSTLTFHLHTQLPGNAPSGTPISFSCRGDSLSVLDGTLAEAALIARGVPAGNRSTQIEVSQRTANVTIFCQNDRIRVSVDGQLAGTFNAINNNKELRGLLIRANVINTRRDLNRGRPAGAAVNPQNAAIDSSATIQVTDFEIRDVVGESIRQFVDEDTREAALTVPRFRRENPPTHILLAPNGDLLRGRLIDATDSGIVFESALEKIRLSRDRVVAIIWLQPPTPNTDVAQTSATDEPNAASDATEPLQNPPLARSSDAEDEVQVVMDRGILLTMAPAEIKAGQLTGRSRRLGLCSVPAAGIRELTVGHWDAGSPAASYTLWIPKFSADPIWDIPEDSGSSPASEMVGEVAPGIQLPTLDGGLFRLPDHKDKIVVLDFWATWCGPCVQALPAYIDVTSEFDSSKVMFIAVNLEETPQVVRAFLKQRQLAPVVAMDRTGIVGAEFNVSGIPHSVIIGPDNVIAHVRIGYRSGSENEMREVIQQLLDGTWKAPEKPVPEETRVE